ncbi:carboxypeptidase-like regulatory domain-containing protein [Mucilaginibacter sp. BJC16-A38]|uniref:carboxypeptidase-like regulatory domain-containing protein n=1 Tax=Mucilaginibacter phenanthrenivorans TaxID=1234842 RepID=UPI0021574AE3|nr:carboxypeptidase-like regulatory domain-containing protein [Mucilaginibacter phenanthrenivorans]MCR8557822.1 carboxypeptidase-like regulatory domain-containing protein [Mucilaginibacter phenanthrenivorans]
MKNIFTITFATTLLSGVVAFGQTIPVTGTVDNEKGQPIPYAFVRDAQHNYATYADSVGAFKLNVDPASTLEVMANNYEAKKININNQANIKIVLPGATAAGSGIKSLKEGEQTAVTPFLQARQQLVVGSGVAMNNADPSTHTGGEGGSEAVVVRSGFALEPTKGSRYLLDDWAPGFGVSKKDSLVVEIANAYSYDKITGNIIFTNDGRSTAGVAPANIKNFKIYDKNGICHTFVNAPEINGKPFVEVLLNTPKYNIYKKIDTKLQRANYQTNGVLETGHRYDEYVDDVRYYFVEADNKPQSISLKKSTLKKLLAGDADNFIASQGSRNVDENYVRELSNSLGK